MSAADTPQEVARETLPISVVIPAYRCEETIERAVRSARTQVPAPAEVIVVDDASPDETGARAAAAGARVVAHRQNAGEGAARNSGLGAAAKEWVAFLDGDDEWLAGHLAELWRARDGHVLVGTAALGCGERADDHRVRGWAGPGTCVLRSPGEVAVPENKVTASSVMVRREEALAAGGFRPGMERAADMDLWLRLLERGTGIVVPRVTALYHQHAAQVSTARPAMDEAARAVLAAYASRPWCSRSLLRRHEGRVAWDSARAKLAAGSPRPRTLFELGARLASPARAHGVVQTLVGRRAVRRLTARYEPGGAARPTPPRGARRGGG
jgi:glycosyltransferase involved in cell wall biosynthesis